MTNYKDTLLQLQHNLNILREREAKYGGNAPLDLLNQISDHELAIALTQQLLAGDLIEAEWHEATRPLLLALQQGQVVNITINTTPEEPSFWRRLSRVNLILAVIGVIAAVLAIPGASDYVFDIFRPPLFAPAADDETLIVIATFYETAATKTVPHTKIRRAIEEAAREVGLDTLRVEEESTMLKADERQQAETLGNLYNASIIIWGEDTGVQVLVNFLNLKQPDFEAAEVKINETERSQLANPDAYAGFILSDLPGQLTFLSFFAVGQSFYQTKNYDQAKEVIEQGIASLPIGTRLNGLADAYFRLGWLYQDKWDNAHSDQGDLAAAIADYTKAIELIHDPLSWPYNNRGIAFKAQGDLAAAIADYNKAIELDPENTTPYNNRGNAHSAQGDLAAAIADYNKAIELDPENASAYNGRGVTFIESGQYDQAKEDLEKALELIPNDTEILTNLGNLNVATNNLEQALQYYNQALDGNPELTEALVGRGIVYYMQNEYEKALEEYEKALGINPDYARAYYNRGVAYYNQGNLTAAIADFEQGLTVDTNPASKKKAQEFLANLKVQQTPSPE
jgi:tetratricopeptide (TPR) repeat protein